MPLFSDGTLLHEDVLCVSLWVRDADGGSVGLLQKFRPPLLEELSHVVSGPADVRVVLVELLAVVEHQVDVDDERLQVLIPERQSGT